MPDEMDELALQVHRESSGPPDYENIVTPEAEDDGDKPEQE